MSDTDSTDKKFQKEMNSGTAALVLLGVLNRAPEPLYGYRIAKLVEQGGGALQMMKHGALYPVLRSLESGGFLSSRVEPSVSGPPRRYYGITEAGREALRRWTEIWNHTKAFVDNALKGIQDEERH